MPRLSPRPVNLFLTSSRRSPSPIPPLASKRDNSILHRPPRTPPRNNHGPISVCRETPPVLPALAFASQRTQDPATNRIGHHPAAETASHLASIAAAAAAANARTSTKRTPGPTTQSKRQQHPQARAANSITRSRAKLQITLPTQLGSAAKCRALLLAAGCPSACSALPLYRSASAFPPRPSGSVPTQLRPPRRRLSGTQRGQKPALSRACTSRKATRASNIVKRPWGWW